MEVVGKIIQKLPLQQGTSKAGNAWSKQIYVLETIEPYPKKIAFDFFGDRIGQYDQYCEVGSTVKLSFDIESREYMGRWYTDIRGWKAEPDSGNASVQQPAAAPAAPASAPAPMAPAQGVQAPPPAATDMDFAGDESTDDIPF